MTLAAQADAEVVIIGKASAKLYGDIGGGMKSVQADLSARAVRIDTGQVIATATTHAAAVHISEIAAGTDALNKAANQAAEEMIGKILAVYSKETGRHAVREHHDHRSEQDPVREVQGRAPEPGARHQGPARTELQRRQRQRYR